MPTSVSSPRSAAERAEKLQRFAIALRTGALAFTADDADADVAAFAWAALDAAGLQGGFRAAVVAAGGPLAVLRAGNVSAFSTPRRRHHMLPLEVTAERIVRLAPWLRAGLRVDADDDGLSRFAIHPVCAMYGFGAPIPSPSRPVVAIVGSRDVGDATAARTRALAKNLANDGAVIVSGGAIGVDTAAAVGARGVGGDVVIIDGRPLQGTVNIPREVLADDGVCWITPYAPWCPGVPKGRFAARNAFIAAMADVVIAVCGGPRSGTRHTVEAALRFGRPVVSIAPDGDDDPLRALGERLVKSGAGAIVDDDVHLAALLDQVVPDGAAAAWDAHADGAADTNAGPVRRRRRPRQQPLALSAPSTAASDAVDTDTDTDTDTDADADDEEDDGGHVVVRLLRARGPMTIDAAAASLDTSVRDLLVDVADLEMDGALRREGALLHLATR